LSEQYTIRHATSKRESFGNYEYEILKDNEIIAHFWHDYRGDEHGIKFMDGTTDNCPSDNITDFIKGGGPEPFSLTPTAIEWLEKRFAQ
jgi:hypothetical protein